MSTRTRELKTGHLKSGEASLPLIKMEVTGVITGLLHRTKVCQTFLNDHKVPLEAVYMHPLPPRASVHGFRLAVGDRVVDGLVRERGAARKAYAKAVARGHRAALMEQERSDIFTTTVGNIAPGEQVCITFELSGPLEFLESTASLRFPLVIPEVYVPGHALGGTDAGQGAAHDTDRVPDASRISPPRLIPGSGNPVDLRLSFTVNPAGLELEKVDSLCHGARTRQNEDGSFVLSLMPGVERLDRDFVIRLKLKDGSLQTTLVHDPKTETFALTVVPPLGIDNACPPRDLVIVLDRSGSMRGWSITAARRAALRIVESLRPQDRFALIAFDHGMEVMDPHLVPAELWYQQRAAEFLAGVEASGGTDAVPALECAIEMLGAQSSADRTVLFITDGEVGNDAELLVRASGGVRVSTVGIGSHSRAGMLESLARTSGGLCSIIPEEDTLEESLRNLHQRLGRPHWMGVAIEGLTAQEQAPRFWDVWEGVPVTFFGRARSLESEVSIVGWLASHGQFCQKVNVGRSEDQVIHRCWARARLQDLDDLWTIGKVEAQELIALSIEAQVLCRFTAFAAIDSSEVVERAAQRKTVVQPVEPARDGWGADGMFDAADSGGASGSCWLGGSAGGRSIAELVEVSDDGWVDDSWVDEECGTFDDLDLPEYVPPGQGFSFLGGLVGAVGLLAGTVLDRLTPKGRRTTTPTESDKPRQGLQPGVAPPDSLRGQLLSLLERVTNVDPAQRSALLDQMMELLAAHCRKAAAGSPEAREGKTLMALLLDLRDAIENGQDGTKPGDRLRAALNRRAQYYA